MTHIPNKSCDMCLMPYSQDPGVRDNEHYCSFCHHDGEFTYEGSDLKEFQRITYGAMRAHGMGKLKAKFFTWSIKFAPYWKEERWRLHEENQ